MNEEYDALVLLNICHQQIEGHFKNLLKNFEKEIHGNRAAGQRARVLTVEIGNVLKEYRKISMDAARKKTQK